MPAPKIPTDLRLYYLHREPPTMEGVRHLQSYFPSLETLFPSIIDQSTGHPSLAAKEMVIQVDLSAGTSIVEDLHTYVQRSVPTWIRKMHLVEPIQVLSGEYAIPEDGSLPTFRGAWQRALRKLNDPLNEAYTDAVFACMASRLVETGRSPHFCRFYGTYNGRVSEYNYNMTDDLNDVEGEPWYREGLKQGAFRVIAMDPFDPDVTAEVTRPWEDVRYRLFGAASEEEGETLSTDDQSQEEEAIEKAEEAEEVKETKDTEEAADELIEADIEFSGTATIHRPPIRLSRVSGEPSGSDSSYSSGSEDDIDYRLIVKDFPVQLTVLERCDGTMDDLMEDEIAEDATTDMRETKEARWTAWMFQVIAGLTTAQQHYDFVHNDLHTNNVMWSGTGETHLYYHVTGAAGGDRFYRVPTFGRIMKIIDFGRATFRPPMAAATKVPTWINDAFAPLADAGGQYNCGPYFNHGMPKVTPNKSFDLCRLAVAMLETLWPEPVEPVSPPKMLTKEQGRTTNETVSPLWNLLWLWLTDRFGKNVLYSSDGTERYPQFDLYCAIARDSQNAIPSQQLTLPLFDSAFRCRRKDIPTDATIWRLVATHKN